MKKPRIMAIASGGGHWKELMLLNPSLSGGVVRYVTTIEGLANQNGILDCKVVKDSNFNTKLALLTTFFQMLIEVVKFRPDVIISTGAAPGILGIFWGRIFGAKTLWIDSIANAEQLSMGGRLARIFAHQVVTQWDYLAVNGVRYEGSIF